jgi:hypothetical protein
MKVKVTDACIISVLIFACINTGTHELLYYADYNMLL